MGVLACPESWAPLPNLVHPQLHLQQRWRLPGSATSCSSSSTSEQQQQQQHGGGMMAMLLPQRWESAGSGGAGSDNTGLLNSANLEQQQIGMQGYCGMSLDLLPQFVQQQQQQQVLSKVPGGGGGGGSLSAFLEQRSRQLLQLEVEQDAAHLLQCSHWNGRQQHDLSPPCDGGHLQHSSCCSCGGDTDVVHWADHIEHRGGPEGSRESAHGQQGDMDAFEVSAAFQFGDSDYGVHHWLKEAQLEPEPSDLLLDYLTATTSGLRAAGSTAVDTELHDCKLIGIQDYLPDLDQHDPCRLVATQAGPVDLDVSVLTSDAEPEPQIVSPQAAAGHDQVELRFGDPDCAVVEAFKAALPSAQDGSVQHPAGTALSRCSSRRRLSMEQATTLAAPTHADEPEGAAQGEKLEERLGSALIAAAPPPPKSRKSAKAGAFKAAAGRENSNQATGLESAAADERSKRKTSTGSPPGPAQQKRSRKAAAPAQDGDKPTQRRTPARSSQAGASRKRGRQSEQPMEAGAADLHSTQDVPPKKGSKAPAPNTKRRRTSPPAAPTAAAAPDADAQCDAPACKPQPSKKSRRSPRGGAARAQAAAPPDEPDLDLPPSSERESHVIAERRRRRSMNFMLSTLGSLLPAEGNNPKPTDRLKVVAQTISYIKGMQLSMKALTQKKAELTVAQSLLHSTHHVLAPSGHVHRSPSKKLPACFPEHPSSQTSSSTRSCDDLRLPLLPVLTLDMFGMEAFITLTCAKARPDFFWKTLLLLDQLRFKVVTAQKSTNDQMAYHSIHVNNKESEKENKDLKSALERLINSLSSAGFHE